MTAGHAQRSHATWSASASARLWACAGSLALSQTVPYEDNEGPAAAWGTACHTVSEDCLRNDRDAIEWIGRIVKTKRHTIEVDEEMADTAQVYIDYVRGRQATSGETVAWFEQNFSLAALDPPFEAGGTADTVLYFPLRKALEVVDLKGGRGVVVEATDNKQARTYAVGAFLANQGLDIEHVRSTIVQPRAPHKDGRIRSETIHVTELFDWTNELKAAWAAADEAAAKLRGIDMLNVEADHREAMAEWGPEWLTAGDHCKFCPMSGRCPEQARVAEAEAKLWFKDETVPDAVPERYQPEMLAPDEIARILDHADMIQDWLNSVRVHAERLADRGTEIPGYVFVEKHGREKWREDAEATVIGACDLAGLATEKFQNAPKLKTPKQVRAALGKGHEKLIDGLSVQPTVGKQLVRQSKTAREAIPSAAQKFLTAIDD